jgi:hypothetical protein
MYFDGVSAVKIVEQNQQLQAAFVCFRGTVFMHKKENWPTV